MRVAFPLLLALFLAAASAAYAAPTPPPTHPADVAHSPSCRHCGMDRGKFGYSRILIEYQDGSKVATCSLHCAAVELANTIDNIPVAIRVADFDTKELVDAEHAVWVLGGGKKGVMTSTAKWAFATRDGADRFIAQNGGTAADFDAAIKAAYDDMYQDTKMIRELRKMKRDKHQQKPAAP